MSESRAISGALSSASSAAATASWIRRSRDRPESDSEPLANTRHAPLEGTWTRRVAPQARGVVPLRPSDVAHLGIASFGKAQSRLHAGPERPVPVRGADSRNGHQDGRPYGLGRH